MVNLEDWDLPVPDWLVFGWLGLLEAILAVGTVVFVISLFEQGGIIPMLPLPRSPIVMVGLVVVLTVMFTVFRMDDVSVWDPIR